MKIVKKIAILAGVAMLSSVGVAQAAAAAELKVAIVNVQQLLQQSPRVASLSKKLVGQFKSRQDKIGAEQKSLQDELDAFKKESPTMSKADKDKMEKKISDERSALVKKVVAYQQDLQKEQNNVMKNILGDLNGIVSNIAKAQNYSLVLDSQAVIYAGNGNDITKEVEKEFNKGA
jgi:outer membrane protein